MCQVRVCREDIPLGKYLYLQLPLPILDYPSISQIFHVLFPPTQSISTTTTNKRSTTLGMADESTPTASGGKVDLTDGESKLFLSIMKHLSSDIQVRLQHRCMDFLGRYTYTIYQFDADAVAAELNYKDGSIVKTRWGQIKRKVSCPRPRSCASTETRADRLNLL